VPTEKEVEDYQERKRVDERKQWDADFGAASGEGQTEKVIAEDEAVALR